MCLAFADSHTNSLIRSQISRYLKNLTSVDLQIVHDGVDIENYDIPAKVIYLPQYKNFDVNPYIDNLNHHSIPAVSTLSFRTGQHQFVFLLSKRLTGPAPTKKFEPTTKPVDILKSIHITASRHIYHLHTDTLNNTLVVPSYHSSVNSFIILLTTWRKKNLKKLRVSLPFEYNHYIFLISYFTKGNKKNKICGFYTALQSYKYPRKWKECREISNWEKRIETLISWQNQWCVVLPYRTRWKNVRYKNSAKISINPFDRGNIFRMEDWVGVAFPKLNLEFLYGSSYSCRNSPQLVFDYGLNDYAFLRSQVNLDRPPDIPIITKNGGFRYLTFYSEQYQSFQIYIAPFQPELWFALLVTVLVLISVYQYFASHALVSFPGWLTILATIFEESSHIPQEIERKIYFRFTFGFWCLMSVILTNCYNGLMISELNAPLPAFVPETFKDLVCTKVSADTTDKHLIVFSNSADKSTHAIDKDLTVAQEKISYMLLLPIEKFNLPDNPYRNDNCFNLYSAPRVTQIVEMTDGFPEFFQFLLNFFLVLPDKKSWTENVYLK